MSSFNRFSFDMHFIAKYLSYGGRYAKKTLPNVPFAINFKILKSERVMLSVLDSS